MSASNAPVGLRWLQGSAPLNNSATPLPSIIFTGVSTHMKISPLHDRVIVKRLEEARKTAGGIVIPDTAAEKPSQGQVVFAGPGTTDEKGKQIPMGVKIGDTILFDKHSAQEFKLDGQDYL